MHKVIIHNPIKILPLILLFFVNFFPTFSSWEPEVCDLSQINGTHSEQPQLVVGNFSESYLIIELENSTGALALDGTPYKFYYTPGQGKNADKWLIFFEGGAFCGVGGEPVLQSCFEKLNTRYGSSSYFGDNGTYYNSSQPQGAFSSMKQYNPMFWDWAKVRLLPMDGTNFQGSIEDPLYYNDTPIYFRGFNNTYYTFEYLRTNLNLFEASEIIIGGGSAGGIAAMQWLSFLQGWFPSTIKISLYADGAMFLDSYNIHTGCYLFRFLLQQLVDVVQLNKTINKIL